MFFLFSMAVFLGNAMAITFINLGTGSTGGTYYPVGAAMTKIWNDNIKGLKASVQSTGGTLNNIQLMTKKQAEMGFADGNYYNAYNGLGVFKGQKPKTFLRGIVPLYPEPIQLLVRKGSGIKTVADFKGRRISIGAVASGTSITAKQFLRLAGLDVEKDIKAEYLGVGDTSKAFSDNHIDAAVMVGALGMAGVIEVTTLGLVEFIDIPEEVIQKAQEESPYWFPFTIPANYFNGQPNAVKTYAGPNIIACRAELPEQLVYEMTKALYDKKADLVAVSKKMEEMKPENCKNIAIPLHPGAVRYYKELGLIK